MNRKLKLAMAALLGFSTACSSVKNAPKKGGEDQQTEVDSLSNGDSVRRHIIVMYGVRPPERLRNRGDLENQPKADSLSAPAATAPDADNPVDR